jgi:tRNA1Val (adenine37-N6)-methyltransferase
MKVGTDGVLLGAWVKVASAVAILDAGTGTGLIAMMMAQRSSASIDAVEMDREAFCQASENVSASPWKDRIHIIHDTFQHYARQTSGRFDLVVSNPPYFRNSLKPPVEKRSLARHDDQLTYESLFYESARILTWAGSLAVIVPSVEISRLNGISQASGLYPSEFLWVRPRVNKEISRCLAVYSKIRPESVSEDWLSIREAAGQGFTEEYKALTRDYYLNF